WKVFGWYGLIASLISTGAYFFTNYENGWPSVSLAGSGSLYMEATTMTLAAIVFCQDANVLNCRTQNSSVFSIGLFKTRLVWYGIIFEILLLSFLIYTPVLHGVFITTSIQCVDWACLFAIPIPLFLIEELRKLIARRSHPELY